MGRLGYRVVPPPPPARPPASSRPIVRSTYLTSCTTIHGLTIPEILKEANLVNASHLDEGKSCSSKYNCRDATRTCAFHVPKSQDIQPCHRLSSRAPIAPKFGREGLHIMTVCMYLVYEGCGSGHFTVDGADNDLRNALAIGSDGVHRGQSRSPLRGITSRCELEDPR